MIISVLVRISGWRFRTCLQSPFLDCGYRFDGLSVNNHQELGAHIQNNDQKKEEKNNSKTKKNNHGDNTCFDRLGRWLGDVQEGEKSVDQWVCEKGIKHSLTVKLRG